MIERRAHPTGPSGSSAQRPATWLAACVGLAVMGLALALRLYAISAESLWLDEAYTYARAVLPLPETIEASIRKHHNPTYFVFMHYFLMLGDDERMLRLPSAIFGALTAGCTCWMAWLVGGARAGAVAGTLLALAPVQVYFGQEARMYTLLSFAAALAMTALLWLGLHLERAGAALRKAKLAWGAYVFGTLAALYLHNTGVFVGASVALAAAAFCVAGGERRWGFARNFLIANALVLGVWGLYLRTLLQQAQQISHNFWAKFPSFTLASKLLGQLYLLGASAWSPLGLLLLGCAALGLWSLRDRKALASALLALAFAGPVLMLLASLHTPIFGVRLLLWTAPPFFVLVALGVASLRHRAVPVAFVALVAALVAPALDNDYTQATKETWRQALEEVASKSEPGARLIAPSIQEETVLDYYLHRQSHPLVAPQLLAVRGSKRNLPRQLRGVNQLWVFDRKRGARAAAIRAKLDEDFELVFTRDAAAGAPLVEGLRRR
jgi:mannosyltransferase